MLHMARADQDRGAAPLASEAPRSLAWCTHKTVREYVVLGYNCPRPPQPRRAPRLLVSGRTRSTSTSPCAATTRLRPHALYVDLAVRRDYSSPAARALHPPRRAPRLLVSGRTRSTSTSPFAATTRLRPHALYVDLAVCRDYSSPAARTLRRPRRARQLLVSGRTRSTSTSLCAATTRLRPHALYVDLVVRRDYSSPGRTRCSDLPRLRCASGCLGTSRGSSRGS
jgi:hypothetical protein